jgi:ElaB/YqjD/DUF883 family membrane-anchored ribosome-binding protein
MAEATLKRDLESAGANLKKEAEATANRVGGEFQRARDQLSQTAAAGRDDIADDLRKLSDDVAQLKDTVAELAKTMASEVGEAATDIGAELASSAKDQASTFVSEFEKVARRNPLGVVAAALGIGFVIGIMRGRH